MESFPLHERLKTRLQLVRNDLHQVLGRLKDEDMPFAPRSGMRTVGGQLAEIAATESQVLSMLKEGKATDWKAVNARFESIKDLASMKATLEQIRAETLALLDSLTEEDLKQTIPMPKGWFESLGREAVPRSEVFRSIAQHEWYHVGQLVSYQWSRGDDPYTW